LEILENPSPSEASSVCPVCGGDINVGHPNPYCNDATSFSVKGPVETGS